MHSFIYITSHDACFSGPLMPYLIALADHHESNNQKFGFANWDGVVKQKGKAMFECKWWHMIICWLFWSHSNENGKSFTLPPCPIQKLDLIFVRFVWSLWNHSVCVYKLECQMRYISLIHIRYRTNIHLNNVCNNL